MMRRATDMAEAEDVGASPLWRWLRIAALLTGVVFLGGVAAGFITAHLERGGPFSLYAIGVLAGLALAIIACGWFAVRALRAPSPGGPPTAKERLNRNILMGSGLLGLVTAIAVTASADNVAEADFFSEAPLPQGVAIALVLMLGVVMPALSVFWHRNVVDEQEADAYKVGALYGLYVYMIGAPVWWFAWRGGFAPEPNGVFIYFATVTTVGVIWIWKKYR